MTKWKIADGLSNHLFKKISPSLIAVVNTNRYTEFPSKGAKIVNGTLSLISFISAKAIWPKGFPLRWDLELLLCDLFVTNSKVKRDKKKKNSLDLRPITVKPINAIIEGMMQFVSSLDFQANFAHFSVKHWCESGDKMVQLFFRSHDTHDLF